MLVVEDVVVLTRMLALILLVAVSVFSGNSRAVAQGMFSEGEAYERFMGRRQGPAGAYVAALSDSEREELRLRLRKRLLGDGPDHPIVIAARAWAVRGTVPQRGAPVR